MTASRFRKGRSGIGAVTLFILVSGATAAEAVVEYGDARIAGFLYSQGAFQHDGVDRWEFVQARNLLNFTGEYRFVKKRRAFGRLDLPFLDSGVFYVQYRGAFDPVFRLRDRYDERFESDITETVERENSIRDLYVDLGFSALGPGRLSLRIGRQQVVWGEADVVRSLDVINPLDLRKNFLLGPDQPNLNEYRIPLWMLKANYAWPQFGPIANPAVEFLYIPGDIEPLRGYVGEVLNFPFDQERRPTALPFRRVRHPFEITRIGRDRTEIPAQAVLIGPGTTASLPPPLDAIAGGAIPPIRADLVWFNKDNPFADPIDPPKNAVPSRSWIDHAEVGGRMLGQFNLFDRTFDFSLNYIYTYNDVPGAFANVPAVFDALFSGPIGSRDPTTGAGITFDQQRDIGSVATIWIPAALIYPRTHIFGGTLTYDDVDFTGSILRLEVSHQTKDPRIKPRPPFLAEREGQFTPEDFEQNFKATGRTTRFMFGSDVFRSFPFLDSVLGGGQPFFISGQVFLEHKENISNTVGTLLSVSDRQKRWNPLYTLLAQYFAKGGRWVWVLIALYDQDPEHFAVQPAVEYHPRNWLTLKVGQIWFTGSKFAESSRFLHAFADRDETFVRLQYEF